MNNEAKILATVGGKPITEMDVEMMLMQMGQRASAYNNPQGRAMILDQLINSKLFLMDAQKNLYEREPAFKEQFTRVKEEMLSRYAVQKAVERVRVTDDEAKKYFESFPAVKKNNSTKILSGNETVDTILAAKAELFDKHNVELNINGSLSRLSAMESMDICILFSNLIDNALEAVAKVKEKRYLHINVTESPNMLMIIFKNPMAQELLVEGDMIKSTKEDAMKHGFGLQNVAEIVEKYKGEYLIETPENEFIMKIVLPM